MSNLASFPSPERLPNGFSTPQAEKLAQIIRDTFDLLPTIADKQTMVDQLSKAVRIIPASRAGKVLGQIVRFLGKDQTWTAEQIRQQVAASGVEASSQEVFNAIGYLVRKGQVQRLGGGQYMVGGAGLNAGVLDQQGRVHPTEHDV